MEYIKDLFDFILHFNDHLDCLVLEYGKVIYAILFAIIFVETGLVVMPFLPGDSLLFAAGALCARGVSTCEGVEGEAPLQIGWLMLLLFVAAVLGDNINYAIGRFLGQRAVNIKVFNRNIVKQAYLDKTQQFFDKHGTKAIILARFVPIVRTFTPFVAGVGKMDYKLKFLPFDIFGGALWISTMSLAGYALGTNQWVKEHFEGVVIAIILISVSPMVIAYLRTTFGKKRSS